jgi:diguanylate cyclase (GGDEF)-like protein
MTVVFQHKPATRAALLLALIGVGLVAWMTGVDPAEAVPAPAIAVAATAAGLGLILVATMLLWWSRPGGRPAGMRDPVTGLYTAAYIDEALPGLMARDDRAGDSSLFLVRVGIDSIGEVRRRYGRQAENLVLAAVARHIRSQAREEDLPAEPDAQGFEIFLHCAEIDQARAFCRRLTTLLSNEQLYLQGDVVKVSVSMAVTVRQLGETLEALQLRGIREFVRANSQGQDHDQGSALTSPLSDPLEHRQLQRMKDR